MSDITFYAAQVIDGIAYGSIYGLFGLSMVLLFRANKLFNFAQTEIATFFVFVALIVLRHFSYFPAMLIMLALSFLGGCALHLGVMRFITERKVVLHSSEALLTIGFYTIFNSLISYIFGDEPQPFPSPFGDGVYTVLGVGVSYSSIGILATSLVFMVLIHLAYRYTMLGTLFESVAENLVAARLRGVRASNILALAWGFSVMIGSVAAILIAPVLFVTPTMFASIFAYSLIAVVIGGLESPFGVMVGGILVGVVENLASNLPFLGTELKFVAVAVLLLVVLVIRPRGLWGRAEGRRV